MGINRERVLIGLVIMGMGIGASIYFNDPSLISMAMIIGAGFGVLPIFQQFVERRAQVKETLETIDPVLDKVLGDRVSQIVQDTINQTLFNIEKLMREDGQTDKSESK